jgi:hypothetical protein
LGSRASKKAASNLDVSGWRFSSVLDQRDVALCTASNKRNLQVFNSNIGAVFALSLLRPWRDKTPFACCAVVAGSCRRRFQPVAPLTLRAFRTRQEPQRGPAVRTLLLHQRVRANCLSFNRQHFGFTGTPCGRNQQANGRPKLSVSSAVRWETYSVRAAPRCREEPKTS